MLKSSKTKNSFLINMENESYQAIDLRLQGKTWKDIKSNYNKHINGLRTTETYTECVIEKIEEIGLNFIKNESSLKKKSIIRYIQDLFGLDRINIGVVAVRLDIELSCKFERINPGNGISSGQYRTRDCGIRTFVSAFDITYEDSRKLCIQSSPTFKNQEQRIDPVNDGICDDTIKQVLKLFKWDRLQTDWVLEKYISTNELFSRAPELKNEKIIICTEEHIFCVDKGIIKDRFYDGFSSIEMIYGPVNRLSSIENIIKDMSPIKSVSKDFLQETLRDIIQLRWISPRQNNWGIICEIFNIDKDDLILLKNNEQYIEQITEFLLSLPRLELLKWINQSRSFPKDLIINRFKISEGHAIELLDELRV